MILVIYNYTINVLSHFYLTHKVLILVIHKSNEAYHILRHNHTFNMVFEPVPTESMPLLFHHKINYKTGTDDN